MDHLARTLPIFFSSPTGIDKHHKLISYALAYIVGPLRAGMVPGCAARGLRVTRPLSGPSLGGAVGEDASKVGSAISMARYVNRLVDVWSYVHSLRTTREKDPAMHLIAQGQNLSLLAFAPLEMVAWLGYTAPNFGRVVDADRFSRLSCLAWLAWILLEVARILRQLRLDAAARRPIDAETTVLALADCAVSLPLAAYWSVDVPKLPPQLVGVLGLLSVLFTSVARWRRAATQARGV